MKGKTKFLAGGLIIAAAVIYLIYSSARDTLIYYYTTSEVVQKVPEIYNERIRLGGDIVPGSLNWDGRSTRVELLVTDQKEKIKLVYQGVVPDNIKNATEVVAEGRYLPAGMFQADNLLVKCPSKYESAKAEAAKDGASQPQKGSGY